mmetsp:Transcript_13033/g.31868  ORF Transcript_13033/g.31868 Transcript_13033/m.31868 type:complete len:222 (-) Transcript_13033:1595-2260(-)
MLSVNVRLLGKYGERVGTTIAGVMGRCHRGLHRHRDAELRGCHAVKSIHVLKRPRPAEGNQEAGVRRVTVSSIVLHFRISVVIVLALVVLVPCVLFLVHVYVQKSRLPLRQRPKYSVDVESLGTIDALVSFFQKQSHVVVLGRVVRLCFSSLLHYEQTNNRSREYGSVMRENRNRLCLAIKYVAHQALVVLWVPTINALTTAADFAAEQQHVVRVVCYANA